MEGAVRSGEAAAEQSPRSGWLLEGARTVAEMTAAERRKLITSTLVKYSGTRQARAPLSPDLIRKVRASVSALRCSWESPT